MPKEKVACDCNIIHQKSVDEVVNHFNTIDDFSQVYDFFHTLGDSTRLRILLALKVTDLCVCDLAHVMNMTKSSISHQLKVLKKVGLVKFRKEGKNVFYSLDDDHVTSIMDIAFEHTKHLALGGKNEL